MSPVSKPIKTRLLIPGFIDPRWLRSIDRGESIVKGGKVIVNGKELEPSEDFLKEGEDVIYWISSNVYCVKKSEQIAYDQYREYLRAEKQKEYINSRWELKRKSLATNSKINLHVNWEPGIKDVLSGLSPNSWGNGRNKATVQHIILLEDFQNGRLKRSKGDFLCTSKSGSNGKRWSSINEYWIDPDGNKYPAEITCKSCLKLAGIKQ